MPFSRFFSPKVNSDGHLFKPLIMALVLGSVFLMIAAGCGQTGTGPASGVDGVVIDLDKDDEQDLLRFYLGGYLSQGARDPFSVGALIIDGDRIILPDSALQADMYRFVPALVDTAGADGVIDWEEFAAFVIATYPEARSVPGTVEDARSTYGNWEDGERWFAMDVSGSMSPYRRRISVPYDDLRTGIDSMSSLEDDLIYPVGTVFVGEHIENGQVIETTFMVKRTDGMWDYLAYGPDGRWTTSVHNEPKDLDVPTQCVGCHVGNRQFEPERSFPAEARPGPTGPRLIHVDDRLKDAAIVGRMREHLKRSDTILGLYGTIYLTRIRTSDASTLDTWERSTRDRLLN